MRGVALYQLTNSCRVVKMIGYDKPKAQGQIEDLRRDTTRWRTYQMYDIYDAVQELDTNAQLRSTGDTWSIRS